MNEIVTKINELKEKKNAVILAHCYQNIEVDEVADFIGDSLYLSQMAANVDADIIVFCGVYFMAETAKILSPDKKVLLPRREAGCLMAEMISKEDMIEFKAKSPNRPVVCYVNSTADVKALSDICCTSANALNVVASLNAPEVLFVPDRGLGSYVDSQLEDTKVIPYPGYCPTHMRVLPQEIDEMKAKYPNALVLVHPECHMEVIKKADFVGSTSGIMNTARESENKEFIIVTEKGVVDRLKRDLPNKEFYLASEKMICENMKWIYLEDILNCLENESPEIDVDSDIAAQAYSSIENMLKL